MKFIKGGSWRKTSGEEAMKDGCKHIGIKWVFKQKDKQDGTICYKARIANLGYMQIPGADYTQSFSLVGNDTLVRIIIGLPLFHKDWLVEIIVIEMSFLEGDLEQSIYIEWPDGMVHLGFIAEEERQEYIIEQLKSMYGNTDAGLVSFKLFKRYLIDTMGMIQKSGRPMCVLQERQNGRHCICCSYHGLPCGGQGYRPNG